MPVCVRTCLTTDLTHTKHYRRITYHLLLGQECWPWARTWREVTNWWCALRQVISLPWTSVYPGVKLGRKMRQSLRPLYSGYSLTPHISVDGGTNLENNKKKNVGKAKCSLRPWAASMGAERICTIMAGLWGCSSSAPELCLSPILLLSPSRYDAQRRWGFRFLLLPPLWHYYHVNWLLETRAWLLTGGSSLKGASSKWGFWLMGSLFYLLLRALPPPWPQGKLLDTWFS